ncbi:MAG: 1,6-anhydro-N-acetylmuramyl-L-alanine amidase AmpD [Betaproteobacteria bacterium]|nr:MAG: 1,6-anhydro-N-acetylmuramyl-L-alanine amidase AmpD [Betaproteobacteria bacterium]
MENSKEDSPDSNLNSAWRVDEQGWCVAARRVPSPNQDARPQGESPSLLVIHNISLPPGEFGGPGVEALFTNTLDPSAHPYFAEIRGRQVSAHFFIRRTGALIQFVPCRQRAWHAGVSSWQGRERCNDFSLGVELEGTDDLPFTDAQYATLNALWVALRAAYPALTAIVGHSDIAPGRKTDPGPCFDWGRVLPI